MCSTGASGLRPRSYAPPISSRQIRTKRVACAMQQQMPGLKSTSLRCPPCTTPTTTQHCRVALCHRVAEGTSLVVTAGHSGAGAHRYKSEAALGDLQSDVVFGERG